MFDICNMHLTFTHFTYISDIMVIAFLLTSFLIKKELMVGCSGIESTWFDREVEYDQGARLGHHLSLFTFFLVYLLFFLFGFIEVLLQINP